MWHLYRELTRFFKLTGVLFETREVAGTLCCPEGGKYSERQNRMQLVKSRVVRSTYFVKASELFYSTDLCSARSNIAKNSTSTQGYSKSRVVSGWFHLIPSVLYWYWWYSCVPLELTWPHRSIPPPNCYPMCCDYSRTLWFYSQW